METEGRFVKVTSHIRRRMSHFIILKLNFGRTYIKKITGHVKYNIVLNIT